MQTEFGLTVNEVLQRPLFQKAQVIAGHSGLHRRVRWVHIFEIPYFQSTIRGEEMILTTGVGLEWGKTSQTAFLEKLIEHKTSCLFVELGHYFQEISDEMIEIANRHHYPLIVFPQPGSFVDMTHDIHSLIINRQYKMLEELDQVSRKFHSLTLSSQGSTQIVKLLQESVQAQVIFYPLPGPPLFVPALPVQEKNVIAAILSRQLDDWHTREANEFPLHWNEGENAFLVQPVGAMGQVWGYVVVMLQNRSPEEFDFLLLDRSALSISQDLLRKRYVEERKMHMEHLWVDDVIQQRITSEDTIRTLIGSQYKLPSSLLFRVFILEMTNLEHIAANGLADELESIRLHLSLHIRSLFTQYHFQPFLVAKSNQIVVLAVDRTPDKPQAERLSAMTEAFAQLSKQPKIGSLHLEVGIGRAYTSFLDTHLSYEEARLVLKTNRFYDKRLGPHYEDLGAFRLLLKLTDEKEIRTFIQDYLGPVIEHDESKGTELLLTLKVYLEEDASKLLSAQRLFVVRQTLYHRLNKIRELLGEDFLQSEKRLSIELALRAYQSLNPDAFRPKESRSAP